jgi:hypothetical protein
VEVTDSDKQPSLLQYGINYGLEKFCSTGPSHGPGKFQLHKMGRIA